MTEVAKRFSKYVHLWTGEDFALALASIEASYGRLAQWVESDRRTGHRPGLTPTGRPAL